MKKKWCIGILVLIIIAIFIGRHIYVSFNDRKVAASISVIGGADGPTSIFVAGKLGEDDESKDEDITMNEINIQIGEKIMTASLVDNDSTKELVALLDKGEIKMSASNYGGFEKVCELGQRLSSSDKQITTKTGDIMLYSKDKIVIFYDSNSWAYTPIGHIDASYDELKDFLSGDEDIVTISLNK